MPGNVILVFRATFASTGVPSTCRSMNLEPIVLLEMRRCVAVVFATDRTASAVISPSSERNPATLLVLRTMASFSPRTVRTVVRVPRARKACPALMLSTVFVSVFPPVP